MAVNVGIFALAVILCLALAVPSAPGRAGEPSAITPPVDSRYGRYLEHIGNDPASVRFERFDGSYPALWPAAVVFPPETYLAGRLETRPVDTGWVEDSRLLGEVVRFRALVRMTPEEAVEHFRAQLEPLRMPDYRDRHRPKSFDEAEWRRVFGRNAYLAPVGMDPDVWLDERVEQMRATEELRTPDEGVRSFVAMSESDDERRGFTLRVNYDRDLGGLTLVEGQYIRYTQASVE